MTWLALAREAAAAMSLATLIRQMTEAGRRQRQSPSRSRPSRKPGRARLRRSRTKGERPGAQQRSRDRHVMSDVTSSRDTPLPDKERSPTPPKEINPTPVSPSLRSGLVNEAVDAPTSKKIQRLESDEKLLDQVTDAWNAWAVGHRCPQVKFLTKSRAQHCRQRLNDIANGEEAIGAFRKVLSKCETSFFIRGSPARG